jgi:hypothetical protein
VHCKPCIAEIRTVNDCIKETGSLWSTHQAACKLSFVCWRHAMLSRKLRHERSFLPMTCFWLLELDFSSTEDFLKSDKCQFSRRKVCRKATRKNPALPMIW